RHPKVRLQLKHKVLKFALRRKCHHERFTLGIRHEPEPFSLCQIEPRELASGEQQAKRQFPGCRRYDSADFDSVSRGREIKSVVKPSHSRVEDRGLRFKESD